MLNDCRIMGNLGADPEVRTTPSGEQVANFRVAVTKRWKDQSGQKQERTEWFTCVAWRKTAEIVQQFLRKGSRIYCQGEMQTRTWEDKNGGGKRYSTELIVDQLILIDKREQGPERQTENAYRGAHHELATMGSDDDLPF